MEKKLYLFLGGGLRSETVGPAEETAHHNRLFVVKVKDFRYSRIPKKIP